MTMGLLAKTALFPLHLWLPPAHAGAPAPGSAVLSALVVKGSFFLIVRLWFDAHARPAQSRRRPAPRRAGRRSDPVRQRACTAPTATEAADRLFHDRPDRLPVLHFSARRRTCGQGEPSSSVAWTGGWLQLFSHAFAKAAMFMAAGLIAEAAGHDRIAELGGIGRVLPITAFTFGLAGLSLMGVPPSGGFVAKWLLLLATVMEGQWWWAVVMLAGGLLAAATSSSCSAKRWAAARCGPLTSLRTRCRGAASWWRWRLRCARSCSASCRCEPSELLQIGRPAALGVSFTMKRGHTMRALSAPLCEGAHGDERRAVARCRAGPAARHAGGLPVAVGRGIACQRCWRLHHCRRLRLHWWRLTARRWCCPRRCSA